MSNDSACRLCLKCGSFKSIFETEHVVNALTISCVEMIVDLVSIPVREHDGLPPTICPKCCTKLKSSYVFKKQCENSFRELIQNVISSESHYVKEEIPDLSFNDELNNFESLEHSLGLGNIKVELNSADNCTDDVDYTYENENNKVDHTELDDDNDDEPLLSPNKQKSDKNIPATENNNTAKKKYVKSLEVLGINIYTLKNENGDFQCNQCPRTMNCRRSFIRHLERHYGIKSYFCEICQKYYAREWVHRQTHAKSKCKIKKTFKCEHCDRVFEQKGRYNLHVQIHSDERPHVCDNCGKAFKRIMNLKAHVKIHSPHKYLCQFCSKEFQLEKSLAKHILFKHTEEKKYKCSKCDKRFATGNCRNKHEKRHLGIKKVSCKLCEKSFFDTGALNAHLLLHTKIKNHACRVCGVKFKRTDHRNRHEMTAHGIDMKNIKSFSSTES